MYSVFYIFVFLALTEILSFISFIPVSNYLYTLKDRGYILNKIVIYSISVYILWILASLRIISFSSSSTFIITFIVIILFSIYSYRLIQKKTYSILSLKKDIGVFVIEEILFLSVTLLFIYLRGINPQAFGTEKFMDFGFLNASLKSQYFPPHDIWLSGTRINYYYYGQYFFAFISRLAIIPSNYFYNLAISFIAGFLVSSTFSVVYNLLGGLDIFSSVFSGLLIAFAGNFYMPYKFLQNIFNTWSLSSFYFFYPASTRVIPFTINEFPIYSFIVADLHAHVIDIMFVLTYISLTLYIWRKRSISYIDVFVLGFVDGIMGVTNSWDAGIYSLFIFLILCSISIKKYNIRGDIKTKLKNILIEFARNGVYMVAIGSIGIILFSPFYLSFVPPIGGIGINNIAHSSLFDEFLLFGFFLIMAIIYISVLIVEKYLLNKKLKRYNIFAGILLFFGIFLIVVPEFIFLKDIFFYANKPYFRANTVFKLYYQSWILLSIFSGVALHKVISFSKYLYKKGNTYMYLKRATLALLILILSVCIISVFSYTVVAINQAYLNVYISQQNTTNSQNQFCIFSLCMSKYMTDNATKYITLNESTSDMDIINYLNKNANNKSVIAEAIGDSYTYYARISANTGLQTVLGWPNHEFQWRRIYYSTRINDIQTLYTTQSYSIAEGILRKYNINYIVISNMEYDKYPSIDLQNLLKLGTVVYSNNITTDPSYLIEVTNTK